MIRDLEPIPTDPGERRLMRAGMLSLALAARGHRTSWFTSSFDHYQKRQRSAVDVTIEPVENLRIEVFRGPGYRRNVSLQRIRHNRDFAARWVRYAEGAKKPDVLVTDIPTTEAAAAVVRFAQKNGIPVVLSIRDLWPDFFVDYLPAPLRPLARPLLLPLDRQARLAAAGATSLVGISEGYLDWGLGKAGRTRGALDRVLPLGYAPLRLPAGAGARWRESAGMAAGDRLVSFVGSWGRTYDLELVLAAARLLAQRPEVKLVVAGDAETRPALRDALRQLPNVIVPGWLSAPDIAALLEASDIGLLPYGRSAPQGLPNKVFEYMAYGAYGVSTLGGELAGFYAQAGGGRVAEPTPEGLAAAIVESLPVGADAALRAARRARFERDFHADVIYRQMAEHIEQVAALKQSR